MSSRTLTEKQPTLGSVLRALSASEEATEGAEMQEPTMFPRRLAFVYTHSFLIVWPEDEEDVH